MKITIDASGAMVLGSLGTREREVVKSDERVAITWADASMVEADSELSLVLKTGKGSGGTVIASQTTFAGTGATRTGWLVIDPEVVSGLEDGAECYLELKWTLDGHSTRTDDAVVAVQHSVSTDGDAAPVDATLAIRSAFLGNYFTAGTGISLSVDANTGVLSIAASLASQAEAEAGLLNTKLMTPLRVAQAIAALAAGGGTWGDITGTLADQTDLQAALDAKVNTAWVDTFGPAPLDSPAFTDTPTAPTPLDASTSTDQLATTAFVHAVKDALLNAAPAQLDTLKELSDALGEDPNFASTMTAALAAKAPLDSPAFTTGATLGGVDIATINNIPNLSGYMQAANNLSDVASVATALGNLGFTITANGNLKLTVNGTDYYFLAVSSEP